MSPFLALIENVGQLILVICVIGGLLLALTIPTVAIYFHHKRQQLWHETARLALEKGQPTPPAPAAEDLSENAPPPGVRFEDWQAARRAESRSQTTKGGLVLLAVGAALSFFLWNMHAKGMWAIGAIPGFIGVALLAHALFESLFAKPRPPVPPQS